VRREITNYYEVAKSEFWKRALTYVYSTVGLTVNDNDDHVKNMLRYEIAPWACQFGVEQCLKDAKESLARYINNQSR